MLFTAHCSADLMTAAYTFSGKSGGEGILAYQPRHRIGLHALNMLMSLVGRPRCWQKPGAVVPAQVPIEARKVAKGVGAEPDPPPSAGWSVLTLKSPKLASTLAPPGPDIPVLGVSLLK